MFSNGHLPPLFGDSFRDNPNWERLTGVEYELIGRILICHLLIEHYLTKFIELETPKGYNWDESRLTFSQKLKLVNKHSILSKFHLIEGMTLINKIRNRFSHNIKAKIISSDITSLKKVIIEFQKQVNSSSEIVISGDIEIIETFTTFALSFIAGYCSKRH